MRTLCALLVACSLAGAAEDARNQYKAGTKTHFRIPEYRKTGDWEVRSQHLRRQILAAAGLYPLPVRDGVTVLNDARHERDGFIVQNLRLETLPGYYLAANLYLPSNINGKIPVVLTPHGHWKHGRVEDLESYSVPALCANLARQGYAAIAYDMVGYNDTTQTPHDFGSDRVEQLWSFNPLALQLWNSIRVVDYVTSLPYIDKGRVAATGASGGATQTFLLAAVDDRIRVSAPVNMVSATFQGGSPCENAPGLRAGTSNVEIAALMAPRPMLLVSSTGDWTRHTLEEEYPQIRRIYELTGAAANVRAVRLNADHNYNAASRMAVYRFFAEHLKGERLIQYTEGPHQLEPHDLLLSAGLPSGASDYQGVFTAWRRLMVNTVSGLDPDELGFRLQAVIGVSWPEQVESLRDGQSIILSRLGASERIPGLLLQGRSTGTVLALHPDGKEAALQIPEVKRAFSSGASVLAIDAFQTGAAKAYRNQDGKYFLTFNRGNNAYRVQDVLTALAFLSGRPGPVRIIAEQESSLWARFAAVLSHVPVVVLDDLDKYDGSDAELEKAFFIPGLQQAGGLNAARLLSAPAGIHLSE